MDIAIFFLVWFFCFGALTAMFPKLKIDILYTFAIGGAINANIFNVELYGFELFGMRFGIDSILYSVFVFCVILAYINFGKKQALKLMLYTIASIFFTAVVSFLGMYLASGYETSVITWTLISFSISAVASLIACYDMIWIAEKLKNRNTNKYLIIFVMFIIAMVLNTTVFYGFMVILGGLSSNAGWTILANAIGKIICLVACFLSYFITQLYINKENKKN